MALHGFKLQRFKNEALNMDEENPVAGEAKGTQASHDFDEEAMPDLLAEKRELERLSRMIAFKESV